MKPASLVSYARIRRVAVLSRSSLNPSMITVQCDMCCPALLPTNDESTLRDQGWQLTSHGAPHVSAHVGTATRRFRHVEDFADHVRIESLLFDGALTAADGRLAPDPDRPGLGLELREADADRYRVAT